MKTAKAIKVDGNVLSTEEKIIHTVIHLVMLVTCFVSLYAFLIIVGSSFQSQREIYTVGYRAIPQVPTLEAYKTIFKTPTTVINAYSVTTITTVVGTIIGLWLTATYGYVISRRDYAYRKLLSFVVLFTMLFNGGLVATYIMTTQWLHLKDNLWVLILPMMLNPWNVIMMKSFFASIPPALIEAAKIDGAGELYIFLRIIIPMSKPVIAAIALFLVLAYWNDYMSSLLYIDTDSKMKLQYMLMKILKDMEFLNSALAADMGLLDRNAVEMPTESARMAMCVVAAGPILIVFPFFQKYFVKGISLGSVKE